MSVDDRLKSLQDGLIEALLLDLQDDAKRTPGLYTVIRGVINDNRMEIAADLDIPGLASLIKESAPFQLPSIMVQ